MFAWRCVVWYNVWCDAGGISCGWCPVSCKVCSDTRARRGDTQLPTERGWYSIDVGRTGAGAGRVGRAGDRQAHRTRRPDQNAEHLHNQG
jgi:hypothetical protein